MDFIILMDSREFFIVVSHLAGNISIKTHKVCHHQFWIMWNWMQAAAWVLLLSKNEKSG